MEMSETEQRVHALIDHYELDGRWHRLLNDIKKAVNTAESSGLPVEMVGVCVATHAIALVAAQKITHAMRPELANALADDFRDTIHKRCIPGLPVMVSHKEPQR